MWRLDVYKRQDKRYVSNFKGGAWDEGTLTGDPNIVLNECAGVLQYAQTIFEGLKAYTTEDGRIVTFRPDLNAERMENSARRLSLIHISSGIPSESRSCIRTMAPTR